jgi:hypothetical protein
LLLLLLGLAVAVALSTRMAHADGPGSLAMRTAQASPVAEPTPRVPAPASQRVEGDQSLADMQQAIRRARRVPPTGKLSDEELGLIGNRAFESVRDRRTSGAVIFGLGLGVATASAVGLLVCATMDFMAKPDEVRCHVFNGLAIAAGVGAGVGLLVGLPLWISGQLSMNRLRAEHKARLFPELSATVGSHGGAVNAAWWF